MPVSHATIARWKREGSTFFPTAPDLAVEVLSPDDRWDAVEQKVRDYLAAEGRAVWVLDPERETVHVVEAGRPGLVLDRDATLSGGQVLPGFSVRVAELFGDADDSPDTPSD